MSGGARTMYTTPESGRDAGARRSEKDAVFVRLDKESVAGAESFETARRKCCRRSGDA